MERNRHHVWHERKWYQSTLDKQFRQYSGFVVLTPVETHNNLHAVIKPPLKPHPELMRAILDHLGRFEGDHEQTLRDTVDFIQEWRVGETTEQEAARYKRMGANILAQTDLLFNKEEVQNGNLQFCRPECMGE